MTTTIRALFIALLTLSLAACQDANDGNDAGEAASGDAAPVAAPAALTAPTTDDAPKENDT